MPTDQAMPALPVLPEPLAVVIASYNYADYVGRAIKSVLDQQEDGCELVVVDDGSTDNSWDVIARTGARAYRVPNGGARQACLFGVERTTAPFVMFLDADDELAPGAVRAIVAALDGAVAKLQFPLEQIDAEGGSLGRAHPALRPFRGREALMREVLSTGVYLSPPTSGNVFRRDLCDLLREATYDRWVDGVMLFAAPFLGDVVSLGEPLARYRVHDRNDSGFGRAPSVSVLERDRRQFLNRMAHLRRLPCVARSGTDLVQPEDTLYHRQLQLTIGVLRGDGHVLRGLPGLWSALVAQRMPATRKIAFAAYLTLLATLPRTIARSLIGLRAAGGTHILSRWRSAKPMRGPGTSASFGGVARS